MNRNRPVLLSAGILTVSAVMLGICLARLSYHSLHVQVLPLSCSGYYVGPMVISFCDGATGRWQPPQAYYEVRLGIFDAQYRQTKVIVGD